MSQLTCSVPEAGRLYKLGVWASYEAAKRGDIPIIQMGRRKLVPVAALADRLGVSREEVLSAISEEKTKREATA